MGEDAQAIFDETLDLVDCIVGRLEYPASAFLYGYLLGRYGVRRWDDLSTRQKHVVRSFFRREEKRAAERADSANEE